MRKLFPLVAAVAVAAGLMAGPVSAHVTFGSLDLDSPAAGTSTTVKVSGTVTCNAGEKFRAGLTLTQGASEGFGNDAGNNCTGSPQSFLVTVHLQSGPGFVSSPPDATGCVRVQTGLPGGSATHGANPQHCEPITLDIM